MKLQKQRQAEQKRRERERAKAAKEHEKLLNTRIRAQKAKDKKNEAIAAKKQKELNKLKQESEKLEKKLNVLKARLEIELNNIGILPCEIILTELSQKAINADISPAKIKTLLINGNEDSLAEESAKAILNWCSETSYFNTKEYFSLLDEIKNLRPQSDATELDSYKSFNELAMLEVESIRIEKERIAQEKLLEQEKIEKLRLEQLALFEAIKLEESQREEKEKLKKEQATEFLHSIQFELFFSDYDDLVGITALNNWGVEEIKESEEYKSSKKRKSEYLENLNETLKPFKIDFVH